MSTQKAGCVSAAKGPISQSASAPAVAAAATQEVRMTARVGGPAPDFEATALVNGSFGTVKLSDYKGKWVVLCFYPGDFTFV